MPLQASAATEAEIDYYTTGECHAFAMAMHRRFGWPMHVKLGFEGYHIFDDDSEISDVIHVYAVSPDGMAWDIRGARPDAETKDEFEAQFSQKIAGTDICWSEGELRTYCGFWGEDGEQAVDRPLSEISAENISAADEVALRVFARLDAFLHACETTVGASSEDVSDIRP